MEETTESVSGKSAKSPSPPPETPLPVNMFVVQDTALPVL